MLLTLGWYFSPTYLRTSNCSLSSTCSLNLFQFYQKQKAQAEKEASSTSTPRWAPNFRSKCLQKHLLTLTFTPLPHHCYTHCTCAALEAESWCRIYNLTKYDICEKSSCIQEKIILEKALPGWGKLEGRKTKRRVKLGGNYAKYSEMFLQTFLSVREAAAQRIFLEYWNIVMQLCTTASASSASEKKNERKWLMRKEALFLIQSSDKDLIIWTSSKKNGERYF